MFGWSWFIHSFQVGDNERKPPLIVDLRRYKDWKDGHLCRSFCVAVSQNEFGRKILGMALLVHHRSLLVHNRSRLVHNRSLLVHNRSLLV